MLTRQSQVGEFYVMSPPQVTPMGSAKYTCDMMIYDEEKDQHVRVQWDEALEATGVREILQLPVGAAYANVAGQGPDVSMGNGQTMKLGDWYIEAKKWSAYNAQDKSDIPADYIKDIRIVVARPFIEHLMHNVIMAVAGRETGATLFGPAE